MKQAKNFDAKIIREISNTSLLYVIDCVLGNSDSGYDLSTESSEFEQNFEEDLEEAGIKPTEGRIKKISERFTKSRDLLVSKINKHARHFNQRLIN